MSQCCRAVLSMRSVRSILGSTSGSLCLSKSVQAFTPSASRVARFSGTTEAEKAHRKIDWKNIGWMNFWGVVTVGGFYAWQEYEQSEHEKELDQTYQEIRGVTKTRRQ